MKCKTCDQVMHDVSGDVYWCPRCGTVTLPLMDDVPELVDRAKTLLFANPGDSWARYEVHECIELPGERPRHV